MKSLIFTLLGFLFLSSCDDSKDIFIKDNTAPVINFSSLRVAETSKIFEDSVKLRNKAYVFNYTVVDDQIITPELFCKGSSNVDDIVELSPTQINLKFSVEGKRILSFYVKDAFSQTTEREAIITSFVNLGPVSVFKLINSNSPTFPLERKLDLSNSYDKDQKYGGKIISYSFQIDNQKEIITDKPFIYHIFEKTGSYVIKLKTKDDDFLWSETLIKTIKI